MPKSLCGTLPYFFIISPVSAILLILFPIAFIKCFICLYSAFELLFYFHIVIFSFSCSFSKHLEWLVDQTLKWFGEYILPSQYQPGEKFAYTQPFLHLFDFNMSEVYKSCNKRRVNTINL